MKYPKYLYRKDDGERFTKQINDKYTMDNSMMHKKYEYSYETLIKNGFVDSIDKCEVVEYHYHNDGHGDYD